jgi:hypothetical protein
LPDSRIEDILQYKQAAVEVFQGLGYYVGFRRDNSPHLSIFKRSAEDQRLYECTVKFGVHHTEEDIGESLISRLTITSDPEIATKSKVVHHYDRGRVTGVINDPEKLQPSVVKEMYEHVVGYFKLSDPQAGTPTKSTQSGPTEVSRKVQEDSDDTDFDLGTSVENSGFELS